MSQENYNVFVPSTSPESIGYQAKKSKVGIDTRADQFIFTKS
jgi:hypothetical protein